MSMVEAIKKIRSALDVEAWDECYEAIAAALAEAEKVDATFQRARDAWEGKHGPDSVAVLDEFFGGVEVQG